MRQWRRLPKDGGILAVSELTWLTQQRPAELHAHWLSQCAEVDLALSKLTVLECNSNAPLGCFVLPESCWRVACCRPMQQRFAAFLARHGGSAAARALVTAKEPKSRRPSSTGGTATMSAMASMSPERPASPLETIRRRQCWRLAGRLRAAPPTVRAERAG